MNKLILTGLLAAVALPTAANAVSMSDVREERHDLRGEQRELQQALRSGDRGDIRDERRDVTDAREEYRDERQDYTRATGDRRYNLGRYHAPRGHALRTAFRGQRLHRAFLGASYVIAQPARYRLAAPRLGHIRWVRYRNDALLVDMRTGAVIAIENNIFW
ncbi:MAG: RcnB family protein [Sphingomonadaceae bacterium]|nr:RcnB family protein [Sphingomonadaceae bacterium]